MRIQTLLEVLDAAHLSTYIDGPFEQRGGIMVIAPPGSFKTTVIKAALAEYPNALYLSDINNNTMQALRDDLVSGRYATMGFGEFEKLYQRNPATAANIEATIKQLVEEGWTRAGFEDQRMFTQEARCLIMGAITPSFYASKYKSWIDSGFARRFLWLQFRLSSPEQIVDAIHEWQKIEFDNIKRKNPPRNTKIKMTVSMEDSKKLEILLRDQPDNKTPLVMMKKIVSVLRWKYAKEIDKVNQIVKDFSPAVQRRGALVDVEAPAVYQFTDRTTKGKR